MDLAILSTLNEELVDLFDYWGASVSPNKYIPDLTGEHVEMGASLVDRMEGCCMVLTVPTWDQAGAREGRVATLWGP